MREIKFKFYNKKDGFVTKTPLGLGEIRFNDDDKEEWIPLQYTGLKDVNGKRIFEGNILRAQHTDKTCHNLGFVRYNEDVACFELYRSCFELYGRSYISRALLEYEEFEIIGTIFENPELLKRNEEIP